MTKESGTALVKKYGKDYFRRLRAKVKIKSLRESGSKGGRKFIERYGKEGLMKISDIGRENFSKRIKSDKHMKEKFRNMFIEKMKKFTRIHPTENNTNVRSRLEQEVANHLVRSGINFEYETLSLPTKYGNCEPDFVIKNKIVVEVFGMNTDFYLKKKIPKISDAINNNPQFRWAVFTAPDISIKLDNCFVTSDKEALVKFIKEIL